MLCLQVIYHRGRFIFTYSPSTKRFARRRVGNRLNLHWSSRTGRAADTNPNYSDITSETVSLFRPYNFLFVLYAAAADARRSRGNAEKKKETSKTRNNNARTVVSARRSKATHSRQQVGTSVITRDNKFRGGFGDGGVRERDLLQLDALKTREFGTASRNYLSYAYVNPVKLVHIYI